jgi:hypothetical protein
MTPIAIATEDQLSEAIVLRLIDDLPIPHRVQHRLGRKGNGYLKAKMSSWCSMAQHQVVVVLTDLDRASCLLEFRDGWLEAAPPKNLLFRIAVREVESWVLADHVALRKLIGKKGLLPPAPDDLSDPKRTFLNLVTNASRQVKNDLLKTINGNLSAGIGYNAHLTMWVQSEWNPERAEQRSPSLAKARLRLHETVASFRPS